MARKDGTADSIISISAETQNSITAELPAEEQRDVLAEFTAKHLHTTSQQHFRVFCARQSALREINFQDESQLEQLRKEFLGLK